MQATRGRSGPNGIAQELTDLHPVGHLQRHEAGAPVHLPAEDGVPGDPCVVRAVADESRDGRHVEALRDGARQRGLALEGPRVDEPGRDAL